MIEYLEKLTWEDEKYDQALTYAEQLLIRADNSALDILAIQCCILKCRIKLLEYNGAVVTGYSAVKLAMELEAWDHFGTACFLLGCAHGLLSQPKEARDISLKYLECMHLYQQAIKYEALVWFNLATFYTTLKETTAAINAYNQALDVSLRTGNIRYAHGIRHALIRAYMNTSDLEPIPSLLAKCSHYLRHHPEVERSFQSRLWHYSARAEFAIMTKRLGRAELVAVRGLMASQGEDRHLFDFHMILGKVAQLRGIVAGALGHYLAARVCAIKIRSYDLEFQAAKADYELNKVFPTSIQQVTEYHIGAINNQAEDFMFK